MTGKKASASTVKLPSPAVTEYEDTGTESICVSLLFESNVHSNVTRSLPPQFAHHACISDKQMRAKVNKISHC